MSETWTTIEQAAVALGLSVRTVNRHISAGKLQSRLQDGRREVLIESAAPIGREGAQIIINDQATGAASADGTADYETVLALADNAADKAELAVSAYQSLARTADERVRASRRLSAVAWSLVAVLALAAVVSVGWTSHAVTRAAVEQEHLRKELIEATATSDAASTECDDLRRALSDARQDAARAEGQLAAYAEPRHSGQTQPTTRPTLTERIASIFEQ